MLACWLWLFALEQDGGDDDRPLGDQLDLDRQIHQRHEIEDQREGQDAEDRADDRRPPAGQGRAADHDRGDRVELVAGAVVRTALVELAGALLLGILNNILALNNVDANVQLLIKGLVIVAAAALLSLRGRDD